MARLKQNIWTIYFIFLIGSLVSAGLIASFRWNNSIADYELQHIHRAEQIASAIHAVFVSQEMLLDVLGQQLLREHTDLSVIRSPALLDELLEINPSLLGFGLARPDGQLILVNSAQDKQKLPNLLQQEVSRDSFKHTLECDSMVVGRTYFLHAIGEWGIPIRKALRNDAGEVIAVMTAGIQTRGASKIFEKDLHYGHSDEVSLIRAQDFYLQYHSSSRASDMSDSYQQPLAEADLDDRFSALMEKAGLDYEGIHGLKRAIAYRIKLGDHERIEAAIYDERYELWITSSVSMFEVWQHFLPILAMYFLVFILVQLMVFWLFRWIAQAEKIARQKLEHQALHDALTHLPNRHFLIERTCQLIDVGVERFSLLFIDIDNFKGINDNFGHDLGDQILQELARRLNGVIDKSELLARLGGDEFVIITTKYDEHELHHYAEKLIASLGNAFSVRNLQFHLGASIGIARYPQHGKSLNALLRAADIAMYEAKKEKNSAEIYRDDNEDSYLRRNRIEQLLRLAINRNELFMMYQPQMDHGGNMVGVEALVRWNSEELGFVPPDQFIAVAETSGLMAELGVFIIERSLQDMRQVQQQQQASFNLSLNISVRQLLQPGFVRILTDLVQAYHFSPHEIVLEITENLFIEDMTNVGAVIFSLRDKGFNISLDDFGTGYSSLSVLQKLPIDELKVDKSFVDDIHQDEKARRMIKNIIAIGKNYGMSVLAEGVETEQQACMLSKFGCDYFQGYWFSKPLTVDALSDFIICSESKQARVVDEVCDKRLDLKLS